MFNDNILGSFSNLLPFTNLFTPDKTDKIVKLNSKEKASTPKNDSAPKDNIVSFKGKESATMEASGVIFPTFKSNFTANLENTTHISGYKIDDQGDTNACGTTSLTSVLKHYGADVKDHWEIDKDIRSTRFDMFTAPGSVIDY